MKMEKNMNKKVWISLLFAAGMAGSSFGATVSYLSDANWSSKSPAAGDNVVIYANPGTTTVTLDVDTAALGTVRLAHWPGSGTLTMGTANTLTAAAVEVGHASATPGGTTGTLNQSAGTVNSANVKVGTGLVNGVYNLSGSGALTTTEGLVTVGGNGTMNVSGGAMTITRPAPNNSGALNINVGGLLEISGGTHSIGGRIYNNGTVRIDGDGAMLNIHQINASSGDFEFIFDSDGVSILASDSWVDFSGSDLVVNGSSYTGGNASFDLVTTGDRLLGGFDNINVTGFGVEGVDYTLTQDVSSTPGTQGTVTLNVIPEPATLGLLAAFGGSILFIRRRFLI